MGLTACPQVLETFREVSEQGFVLPPVPLGVTCGNGEGYKLPFANPSPLGEPYLISGALGNDFMSVIYILKLPSLNQDFP